MSLILHGTNVSPPTRAVMMLIDILGIKVQFKEVSLPKKEHYKAEHMSKNPLHTIPMLEDDGFIVIDSHAIMTYLVSKYDEDNNLYPKDLKERCLVDQRLYFDASILFPRLRNVIYGLAYKATGVSGVTDQQKKEIEEAYSFLEEYLKRTPYVAGKTLSLADLSCVATLSSLEYVLPVNEKYVKIYEWWGKLKKERWYMTKNSPGAKIFGVFMSSVLRW